MTQGRDGVAGLLPHDFVSRVRGKTRPSFAAEFRDTPFLLVQLEAEDDPFVVALAASLGMGMQLETSERLAFETSFASRDLFPTEAQANGVLRAKALRVMRAGLFFVLPMRKAAGHTPGSRLSVGRARSNDIALRDSSVSKFHGWFERDASGVFSLIDGRSRNGTKVNGKRLSRITAMPLNSGDEIFGTVRAFFCAADLVWDAVV